MKMNYSCHVCKVTDTNNCPLTIVSASCAAQRHSLQQKKEQRSSEEAAKVAVSKVVEQPTEENKLIDDNPKTSEGVKKRQLQLVPLSILEAMAGPFTLGAEKYGPFNYLVVPVHASTYLGAALRHIAAYQNGEETDPDTGECHLHSALASLGIIVAARAAGTLVDDGNALDVYHEWLAVRQEKKE
jgi:hypothetical protein